MQIFIVILFIGAFAFSADDPLIGSLRLGESRGWVVALWVFGPKVLLAGCYALLCWLTLRRMTGPRGQRWLRAVDKLSGLYRVLILLLYFHDLVIGALHQLRQMIGMRVVGVSELLIMTPSLAMVAWGWWSYYPIDARIRNAQMLSRIDQGLPVHATWSRGQFLAAQLRYQVALLFLPLMVLMLLTQTIEYHVPGDFSPLPFDVRPLLQLAATGCVFLFAPLMMRHIWDTTPLADGELRDDLLAMCRQHHVGVRELLIWRTFGGIINAVVMGLIRPLRYILLSDGLLEMLPKQQVRAVMAHELAHVRRRHMAWMMAAAIAMMMAMMMLWTSATAAVEPMFDQVTLPWPKGWPAGADVAGHAGVAVSAVCWFFGFGWVSRRFERQADTFAVQHMVAQTAGDAGQGAKAGDVLSGPCVDYPSVTAMIEALEQVARLNHIDPGKKSWRHGSIVWRQQYLRSLVGRRADRMAIDRQVLWIKAATVVLLGASAAVLVVLDYL